MMASRDMALETTAGLGNDRVVTSPAAAT